MPQVCTGEEKAFSWHKVGGCVNMVAPVIPRYHGEGSAASAAKVTGPDLIDPVSRVNVARHKRVTRLRKCFSQIPVNVYARRVPRNHFEKL
jgi:hypothetical protein